MIYHTAVRTSDSATWGTFDDLDACVLKAVRTCEAMRSSFDFIAVQGVSGMSIGFPLAVKLGCPIVVVRKDDEDCHGSRGEVVGRKTIRRDGLHRGLFVDDFVSMGSTRSRVTMGVESISPIAGKRQPRIVAQYTSQEDSFESLRT